MSHGRLLLVPLLEAQYYAVQVQDRALFAQRLQYVLDAPETLAPGAWALLNAAAKHRAALLLRRIDDTFSLTTGDRVRKNKVDPLRYAMDSWPLCVLLGTCTACQPGSRPGLSLLMIKFATPGPRRHPLDEYHGGDGVREVQEKSGGQVAFR